MLCRVTAVKMSPRTLSYCRLYFISFGIIDPILVILKIEYRFSRRKAAYAASQTTVLHMKRLNQTESPIFVILCVLCFQRQSSSCAQQGSVLGRSCSSYISMTCQMILHHMSAYFFMILLLTSPQRSRMIVLLCKGTLTNWLCGRLCGTWNSTLLNAM